MLGAYMKTWVQDVGKSIFYEIELIVFSMLLGVREYSVNVFFFKKKNCK